MQISTTYTAEVVKLLTVFALLFGLEVNDSELEATVAILLVIGTSVYTLYRRWKKGGISAFGVRK